MRTRFSIDTASGAITRTTFGAAVPAAQTGLLTARDIMECEVQFTAGGQDVTTEVLATGVVLRLGLRQNTSDGVILAQSDTYTMDAGVAVATLSLNTQEVIDLVASLPLTARTAKVYFEVEISAADGSWRETIAQQQFTLQCEVNEEGDVPPAAAADSATSAAASATAAANSASAAATSAASVDGPSIVSRDNARAPRQGLVFDGTAGATVANVPAFGTVDFTAAAWIRVTDLTSQRYVFGGAANSFGLRVNTDGTLSSAQVGVGGVVTSTGSVDSGKSAFVAYVRASGIGTFYINGVASGSASDATNYSVATTNVGVYTTTPLFVGEITPLIENRALSAAEVLALYESGAPAGADYQIVPIGTECGNTTPADLASSVARFTTQSTFRPGLKFLFTPSWTGGGSANLQLSYGVSNQSIDGGVKSYTSGSAYEITLPSSGFHTGAFYVLNSSGATLGGFSFSLKPEGLLLAPSAHQSGAGSMWYDTSGNGADISLPASGVTWALPAGRFVGKGTTTNDNAAAGLVGEYVSASVASGSAVSLTTATAANVTSITLTAGDWDVTGQCDFTLTGASTTLMASGSSPTSATLDVQDSFTQFPIPTTTVTGEYDQVMPTRRVSIAATTIFYLVTKATFSAGTVKAFGTIRARRVR